MIRLLTFAAFLLLEIGSPAFAEPRPQFPAPPPGFRIGMEIELLPDGFAPLTRYFDFDSAQKESNDWVTPKLTEEMLNDYLRDRPEAFESLPSPLKERLSHGLQLESLIEREKEGAFGGSLLGPDGKPVKVLKGIETISIEKGRVGQLVLPNKQPETPPMSRGLELPKRLDWQELYDRWNALPLAEKRAAVRWELLSDRKKAEVAIQFLQARIQMKSTAPDDVKALFNKLSWHRDGDAIEFIHKNERVISDPAEFYNDVSRLVHLAGPRVERKILNPDSVLQAPVSFHYHISVQDKNLDEIARRVNQDRFLSRLEKGVINDVTRKGSHLYDREAKSKGLVKIIASDRYETRTHEGPLAQELESQLRWIQGNLDEGKRELERRIQSKLTDSVIEKIAGYQLNLLSDFVPYFSTEQRLKWDEEIHLMNELMKVEGGDTTAVSKKVRSQLPSLLQRPDTWVQGKVLLLLGSGSQWDEDVWRLIPKLLTSNDEQLATIAANALLKQEKFPNSFWNDLVKVIPALDELRLSHMTEVIRSQSPWPPALWEELLKLYDRSNEWSHTIASYTLESRKSWPDSVWRTVVDKLKNSRDPGLTAAIIDSLDGPKWSPVFLNEVPQLLGDSRFLALLARQREWHPDTLQTVVAALKKSKGPDRRRLLKTFKLQDDWPQEVQETVIHELVSGTDEAMVECLDLLQNRRKWSPRIWEGVIKAFKKSSGKMTSKWVWTLGEQKVWPRQVWSLVGEEISKSGPEMRSMWVRTLLLDRVWPLRAEQLLKASHWLDAVGPSMKEAITLRMNSQVPSSGGGSCLQTALESLVR